MAPELKIAGNGYRKWRTPRRVALVAVEILITVAALVLIFRGLDLGETWQAVKQADYWLLAPAVVFLIMDLQLRAVRWRLLLWPQRGLRHNNLFGATNVGYLVNDILPFRVGEVARAFTIDSLEQTGKVRALGSIAVERGIDVIAMVLLVIALLPFIDEPDWARGPALMLGALVLGGFIVLLGMTALRDAGKAFWRPWLRSVPRFGRFLDEAADTLLTALLPLRKVAILGSVTLLTAVIWACGTLSFFMVVIAFHMDVGLAAAGLVIAATTLGMVVPSSPGYVGVFHAIAVETLVSVFGVQRETALTYAFAQHALIYFVPAAFGVVFLWRHRTLWRGFVESISLRWTGDAAAEAIDAEPVRAKAGRG
jgi:uncharacterized protein (TIRG00374 family)